MAIQLIECDKIAFPKTGKRAQEVDVGVAQGIADSIRAERMYNPIVVRPHPDKPGHFVGVQGKHRLYAKARLLKERCIECSVFEMDDEEAEMAGISENVFRLKLSQYEKTRAVKRWHEIFKAKHPELVGKGAAGGAAMKRKAEGRRKAKAKLAVASKGDTVERTDGAIGAEDENAASFSKRLAAATDVSETTAKREQRLAINLTDAQIDICEREGLTKGQMESIANIKDEEQREAVLGEIEFGIEFDEAWRAVNPDAQKATGKSRELEAAESAAEQEEQPKLSDDEWFNRYCAEKAALLGSPAKFKADALVFRRITEPRLLFRSKVKATLQDAEATKVTGPFHNAVDRVVSVSHPRDWPLCSRCEGGGFDGDRGRCMTCAGAGYLLKSEPLCESLPTFAGEDHHDRVAAATTEPDPSIPQSIAEIEAMFANLDGTLRNGKGRP